VPLDALATSLAAANGRVYVTSEIGGLDAFRQDNGRYQWTASAGVPAIGAAAVDDKHAYVALLDSSIRTLGAEDGSQRWRERLEGRPRTGPLLVGPNLCVGLTNGQVTCLPRTSGRPAVTVAPPPLPDGSQPVNPRLLGFAVSDAGLIARATSEFTSTRWLTLAKPPEK
jgi:outer membrane protein assembly factor BamB